MSDMMSVDQELAQARMKVAALEAENARLRGEQGMIRTATPTIPAVMPASLELRELFDAALARFPDFVAVEADMFARAFRVAATFHRQESLNKAHYWTHWVGTANGRLRARGEREINSGALLLALLCWGDVEVTDWRLKKEGILLEASLNEFTGRLPTDQWRKVLVGEFPKPIDPRPQRKGCPVPPVNILIDGKPLPDPLRHQGPRYW